jgi:hypothetical protein
LAHYLTEMVKTNLCKIQFTKKFSLVGAQTQTSFSNEYEERNKFESLSDSYTNNPVDLLTRPGYKHFTKQDNPHDRGPYRNTFQSLSHHHNPQTCQT